MISRSEHSSFWLSNRLESFTVDEKMSKSFPRQSNFKKYSAFNHYSGKRKYEILSECKHRTFTLFNCFHIKGTNILQVFFKDADSFMRLLLVLMLNPKPHTATCCSAATQGAMLKTSKGYPKLLHSNKHCLALIFTNTVLQYKKIVSNCWQCRH